MTIDEIVEDLVEILKDFLVCRAIGAKIESDAKFVQETETWLTQKLTEYGQKRYIEGQKDITKLYTDKIIENAESLKQKLKELEAE